VAQNDIQRSGLNDILRRSLTIKGDLPPSPVVGAEIVPVLTLENDRPEYAFLAGERLCHAHLDNIAVAAQFSKTAFENPQGSGLLAVMEGITGEVGTAGNAFFNVYIAGPDTPMSAFIGAAAVGPLTGQARDFRWARTDTLGTAVAPTSCVTWQLVSATDFAGGIFTDSNVAAFTYADILKRIGTLVIPPGWKIGIRPGAVNQGSCVSFVWRERPLEPNEGGVNMRR
jgi:hypothetical protein